ncbi:MAG: hypothetical protein QF535_02360 [Anaerolineales bacterium]|nr:hypothetical protein [Anaerolineales bacterium]
MSEGTDFNLAPTLWATYLVTFNTQRYIQTASGEMWVTLSTSTGAFGMSSHFSKYCVLPADSAWVE